MSLVLPGLVLLVLAAEDTVEVWYMLAFVPAVAISMVRYLTRRYLLTEDHLVILSGLVFRSVRHIPYGRIQNIDTVQNPLHRLLHVAEVRLETAGGQEPEAVLRVLPVDRLRSIERAVLAARAGRGAAREAVEERPARPAPFFRMSSVDLVLFGLLSQKGIAILVGLLFVVAEFDLGERLLALFSFDLEAWSRTLGFWGWAIYALLLVFTLQLLTVGWAFLTLHDFRIVRTSEGLTTTCGLWTHQSATLPRHRIQCLSVREGFLQRRFERMAIRAVSAGGDSTENSQISRKWLIPLARSEQLAPILREVQPEVELAQARWTGVHPRAFRRLFARWTVLSILPAFTLAWHSPWGALALYAVAVACGYPAMSKRARRLAWALGPRAILIRDGVLTDVRNVVRFSKIQSVSLTQSPLDRRHQMATVRVDTAGPESERLSLRIPYLPLRAARRLARELQARAARSTFRW